MLRRIVTGLAVLALTAGFLWLNGGALKGFSTSAYASTPGSDSASALPIPAKPATVSPGQRIWYGIQHTGDRSQILSDLKAAPDNSASFAVYTPAGTATPVGRGSQQTPNRTREDGPVEQNTPYGGDLIWSGSFRSPVTYYVDAKQTGPNSSAITLGITGSGVSAPHTR